MTEEKRGVARAADHLYYASVVLINMAFVLYISDCSVLPE